MDRGALLTRLNHWYPVLAALLSSLLNVVSFLAGVGFTLNNVVFLGVIVVGGLAILSAATVLVVYRLSLPVGTFESQILDSTDECDLQDMMGKVAVYRRTETIRVLRDCSGYRITLPIISKGFQRNFRAHPIGEVAWYHIEPLRWIDGIVLFVNFGRLLKKGEVVENLRVEWDVHDCYTDEYEGMSVMTDPGQQRCCIRVLFPPEASANSISGEYYKIYPPNTTPLERGDVTVHRTREGRWCLEKVFENLPPGVSVKCGIGWRWCRDEVHSRRRTIDYEQAQP